MNSCPLRAGATLLFLAGLWALSGRAAAAEQLRFSKRLTPTQVHCLDDLLNSPDWGSEPNEKRELKRAARVATAPLGDNGRTQYIYLFKTSEFCESNVCLMIIGELSPAGVCHLLYDSDSNGSVSVLGERNHGYRRIETPCEAHFDGHQYQLFHQDCRNAAVYHSRPIVVKDLLFSKRLTPAQTHCLDDLLSAPSWGGEPDEKAELKRVAQVATAGLSDNRRTQYIYLFETPGFCGSAGFSMIIGEVHGGGCHMLYDYDSDGSFTVLRERDHGYHRLWSPCEARYDGRQYQLLHESCPNAIVYH
jgi:hypothetical protein